MSFKLLVGGFRSFRLESAMVAFRIHRKLFICPQIDWAVESTQKAKSLFLRITYYAFVLPTDGDWHTRHLLSTYPISSTP